MKRGYLSEYFTGVAVKVLSAVETDIKTSNQHEYNGVSLLKNIFGTTKRKFEAKFIYYNDYDEPISDLGSLTWYDTRENQPKRSAEYRMYFTNTDVSACAVAGDELFIGLRPDDTVMVIIAESGSTICNQLRWLFGLEVSEKFNVRVNLDSEQDKLEFASGFVLEQLGISVEESEDKYLDMLIQRFGENFPATKIFSAYARETLKDVDQGENPDVVLMMWMEREETLFRTFERHLVSERLATGFNNDVDGFFKYSLSAHNRRKSRVGHAFENHVEQLFIAHNIQYDRTKVTENNSKPDFIFPSIDAYHNPDFNSDMLTMLGVKSTCKDRWRQVLTEAERVKKKHLLTLETAISTKQTNEMKAHDLQLVVPVGIKSTYDLEQQKWLLNVSEFMEMLSLQQSTTTCH